MGMGDGQAWYVRNIKAAFSALPAVPFPHPHNISGPLQLVDGLTDGVNLLPVDNYPFLSYPFPCPFPWEWAAKPPEGNGTEAGSREAK